MDSSIRCSNCGKIVSLTEAAMYAIKTNKTELAAAAMNGLEAIAKVVGPGSNAMLELIKTITLSTGTRGFVDTAIANIANVAHFACPACNQANWLSISAFNEAIKATLAGITPLINKLQTLLGKTLARLAAVENQLLNNESTQKTPSIPPKNPALLTTAITKKSLNATIERNILWSKTVGIDTLLLKMEHQKSCIQQGISGTVPFNHHQWNPQEISKILIAAGPQASITIEQELKATLVEIFNELAETEADFEVLSKSTFDEDKKIVAEQELLTNRTFLRIHAMLIKKQLEDLMTQQQTLSD